MTVIPLYREGYEEIVCAKCGIAFCVPDVWAEQKLRSLDSWWCPNGDNMRFVGEPHPPTEPEPELEPESVLKKRWCWK